MLPPNDLRNDKELCVRQDLGAVGIRTVYDPGNPVAEALALYVVFVGVLAAILVLAFLAAHLILKYV